MTVATMTVDDLNGCLWLSLLVMLYVYFSVRKSREYEETNMSLYFDLEFQKQKRLNFFLF